MAAKDAGLCGYRDQLAPHWDEELNDGKIVILLAPRGIAPKPCPRCAGAPAGAFRWGSFRALITP
jgi:hypothetical protein